MPNPYAKYAQAQPGVIPLGQPDPTQQYKLPTAQANLTAQQQQITKNQQDINSYPVQQQGQQLNNQQTAQSLQFDRSKVAAELSGRFAKDQRVVDYRTVLPNVVSAMSADKGKQGDLTVVYAWAKAMDPAGSVRDSDTDLATGTSSYIQQAKQWIGRINSGKGLPPEVRTGLINEMRNKGHILNQAFSQARKEYAALAQQGGIPPQVVIGEHDGGKYQQIEANYKGAPVVNLDGGQGAVPTAGKTQTQTDPNRTATLDTFIKRAAPFEQANQWAIQQGGDPLDPRSYQKAVQFAKSNPGYTGSLADFTVTTPTTPTQQVLGGLVGPDDIGYVKGFKESLDRAAVGAQGLYNETAGRLFGESDSATQAQQQTQDFFGDKNVGQTGETLGRLSGATVFASPFKGPMTAGAAGNLMMTDSTGWDAAGDAALGAAGGWAGDKALQGIAALMAPQGRDAMGRLAQEGVQFSPGQMIGGAARNFEDRLTANPVLGPKIDAIREQGLNAANRIPANRALAPIGQSLPENIPAGHEAVNYTKQQLGNAYDNALSGQTIGLDPTYINRLNAIGQRANMRPQEFNQFGDIVQREVGGAFQTGPQLGQMSGNTYKKLDSRLGQLSGDLGKAPDVFARDIADSLRQVKDQTRALARRQNPAMGDALRNTDEGYANFKILERAAAANPATGIFTPGQLRTAVRGADRSVGKGATARGEARMQDLASDMSEALPSGVGSSGTSEREQVNKLAPWVMGSLMSPLYSKPAQKALEKLLLREPGPDAKNIAKLMRSLPRGMFGGGAPLLIESGSGY